MLDRGGWLPAKYLNDISLTDHMIGHKHDLGSGARRHEHTFPGGYRMR